MAWQLGDYCTVEDVRRVLKQPGKNLGSADDDLIEDYIKDVSDLIRTETGRHFHAVSETRYFHAEEDIDGRTLLVDEDLLAVTTITVDEGATEVDLDSVVLLPRNNFPKNAIRLKRSSSTFWSWHSDPDEAIAVEGSWGYNAGSVPPRDIKRACIQAVEWNLWRRTAPFNTVQFPAQGAVEIPVDLPSFVKSALERYKKRGYDLRSTYEGDD